MDIKTSAQRVAHRYLAVVRVAARWIEASMDSQYDLMLRLQILEGAAQVHEGTWWKGGAAKLLEVKSFFKPLNVKPIWFEPGTQLVGILKESLRSTIHKLHLYNFEPYEIIDQALMGSFSEEESQPTPYWVGSRLSNNILHGKESPKSVAVMLGYYLKKKLWVKSQKSENVRHLDIEELEKARHQREDDGEDVDFEEGYPEKNEGRIEAGELLTSIVFSNLNDPLGKRIRQLMRDVWYDSKHPYAKSMNIWLNSVEQGRFPLSKDVADRVGIRPQEFSQRHWGPAWRRFFDALWSNSTLLRALQDRYEEEGAEWFQKKPRIEELTLPTPVSLFLEKTRPEPEPKPEPKKHKWPDIKVVKKRVPRIKDIKPFRGVPFL